MLFTAPSLMPVHPRDLRPGDYVCRGNRPLRDRLYGRIVSASTRVDVYRPWFSDTAISWQLNGETEILQLDYKVPGNWFRVVYPTPPKDTIEIEPTDFVVGQRLWAFGCDWNVSRVEHPTVSDRMSYWCMYRLDSPFPAYVPFRPKCSGVKFRCYRYELLESKRSRVVTQFEVEE